MEPTEELKLEKYKTLQVLAKTHFGANCLFTLLVSSLQVARELKSDSGIGACDWARV